jgi:SAM-dependent methyltransferase
MGDREELGGARRGRLTIVTSERVALSRRYTKADLRVFTQAERRRFLGNGTGDPQTDAALAWELLYRLEPHLYDRLTRAEPIHPAILEWLPGQAGTIVEVGAGSGRLTEALLDRCDHLIAIEPAAPLRDLLAVRLQHRAGRRLHILDGFFDSLPAPDRSADLVIACSAFTPDAGHGGPAGLREMERVCAAGGTVVIVWPNHLGWLAVHGYRHRLFPGDVQMEFASFDEAIELAEIFFPGAVEEIRRRGDRRVPYDVLGVNPPRDVAYKAIGA